MIGDDNDIVYNKLPPLSESKFCAVHLPQGRKPAGATAAMAADVTAIMLVSFRCKIYEKTYLHGEGRH